MLDVVNGEIQIRYRGLKGCIYIRILMKNQRVDAVATGRHDSVVANYLGSTTKKDSKGYPIWLNLTAYQLACLITHEINSNKIVKEDRMSVESELLKNMVQETIEETEKETVNQVRKRSKLTQAEKELKEILQQLPAEARPFVSYGNPLTSDVIIVGFNPATGGVIQWGDYWEPPVFHGQRWRDDVYLAMSDKKPSPTWRNMKRLEDAASGITFTETNVYSMHSPDASSLGEYDTTAFDALIKLANPKLIIVHGKDACDYLSQLIGINVPFPEKDSLIEKYITADRFDILPVVHFSRKWSYANLDALGKKISKRYEA